MENDKLRTLRIIVVRDENGHTEYCRSIKAIYALYGTEAIGYGYTYLRQKMYRQKAVLTPTGLRIEYAQLWLYSPTSVKD